MENPQATTLVLGSVAIGALMLWLMWPSSEPRSPFRVIKKSKKPLVTRAPKDWDYRIVWYDADGKKIAQHYGDESPDYAIDLANDKGYSLKADALTVSNRQGKIFYRWRPGLELKMNE